MELAELLSKLGLHTFIAFDFETTGLNPSDDKITESAAVRFEEGVASDSFQTLVNPQRPIPPEIVRKTGISDEMVKDAPNEDKIVEKMFNFIGDHPIVAHNLPFDLSFLSDLKLNYLSQEVKNEGYDTVPLAQAFLFFLPNHQLGTIAEYLGSASENTHRALADTEILGQLFLKLVREAASYPLAVIQKVLSATEGKMFYNKTLYINLGKELAKSGNMKEGLIKSDVDKVLPLSIFQHEGSRESLPASAGEFFASDGLLARSFSDSEYEVRESQINYADFVKDIFDESAVGLIEAGTGLGKSLAYLMSSLRTALAEGGEPVIISCHTKPLQDQLFQREIPKLAVALDVSFSATLMKGRHNYVCLTRVDRVIADAKTLLSEQEVQSLIVILIWLQWTKSGDFEECT
ncbi:MAG: exonuclease domain-containing protein, partial [Dehalococcoidia bacterium]|nr:exonuclease domain-containing protein [Dehalococcoidia bacterium]